MKIYKEYWEFKQQRRGIPENSHQSHEQVNKEKKERTQDLTKFDNLSTSSGQRERVLIELINYGYKYWTQYPSLYGQRSHEEKKTKNT